MRVRCKVTSLGWLGPPEVSQANPCLQQLQGKCGKFCDMKHHWASTTSEAISQVCGKRHRADMAASHLLLCCPLMTYFDPPQRPRTGPRLCPSLPRDLHFSTLPLGAALIGGQPSPTPPASAPETRPGRPKARMAVMPEARKP